MNIKIKGFRGSKEIDKERVVLSVTEDMFLGSCMAMKTKRIDEKNVSSSIEKVYWFPDKDLKKGDLVVLYTKSGISTENKNEDGTTTHFFYWSLGETLWTEDEDALLLVDVGSSWTFKAVADTDVE